MKTKSSDLSIGSGLSYPWGKAGRLWNILWILVPIYGWFALAGYVLKIVHSLMGGDFKALPKFGSSAENFKEGFWLVLKWIPIWVVLMVIQWVPVIGQLVYVLASIFVAPYLFFNLCMKKTVSSTFELGNVFRALGKDFIGYLVALLKTILYVIVYGLASVVLVGIPCLVFGNQVFMVDWFKKVYRK